MAEGDARAYVDLQRTRRQSRRHCRAHLQPDDQPRVGFPQPVWLGKKGTEYGEKQNDYRVEFRILYHFGFKQ